VNYIKEKELRLRNNLLQKKIKIAKERIYRIEKEIGFNKPQNEDNICRVYNLNTIRKERVY